MTQSEIIILLQLAIQYGPGILDGVEKLFQKPNVTIADIQAVFAGLQPYAAFGIPASPPQLGATPVAVKAS